MAKNSSVTHQRTHILTGTVSGLITGGIAGLLIGSAAYPRYFHLMKSSQEPCLVS